MNQRSLFDPVRKRAEQPAPHSGGQTSQAAAEAIQPSASTLREMVFTFIKEQASGVTREEIQSGLQLSGDTVRPRVWELIKAQRVVATAETRKTASGRAAEVLKVSV